jgi:hypothetical protein
MTGVRVVPTQRRIVPVMVARLAPAALALLGVACAEDLRPNPGPADAGGDAPTVVSMRMGEVVTTTVDATWPDTWVYFDFETGAEVAAPQTTGARSWDVAFQRFKVMANGGVNGSAGVEVAMIADRALDDVDTAPSTGWLLDAPDGADGNPDPDTVFNRGEDTWFDYDVNTHVLSAKKRIYVVRTADEGYFAVQLLSYYDDFGNGGYLRLRWKPVKAATGRVPATPVAGDAGAGDAGAGDLADDAGKGAVD